MARSVTTGQRTPATPTKSVKKKRTPTATSYKTSQPVSGSFPQRVRKAVNMAAEEMCFMCDLEADHCAHVIAEADRSIRMLSERGLINFDLMSEMNGVALCGACHIRYEDHCDPRLIFYPTDIEFFIAFELRDRIRRRKDGSSRTVPTAAQYAKWCGLYTRIVFRRKGQNAAIVKDPARWPGAPLAALRRAFVVMGCPRADGIPEEDMLRLRDLWDLYFRDKEDVAQTVATRYGFSATEEDFGLGGFDSDNDEPGVPGEGSADDGEEADKGPDGSTKDWGAVDNVGLIREDSEVESGWGKRGVERDEEDEDEDEDEEDGPDGPVRKRRAAAGTWQQPKLVHFNYRNWCWVYGPSSSSNQKAKTFTSFVRNP